MGSGIINKWIVQYVLIGLILVVLVIKLVYLNMLIYQEFGYKEYHEAYVSDEVWYVPASRNLLVKVFGISSLRTNDSAHRYYTIVFEDKPNSTIVDSVFKGSCFSVVDDNYSGCFLGNVTVFFDNASSSIMTVCVGSGLNAVYVRGSMNCSVDSLISLLDNRGFRVVDIVPGWALPDKKDINDYFNLEHPPLGKYIIGLSLVLFGDYPFAWRVSSILATTLVFVLAYLITIEVLKSIVSEDKAKWISIVVPFIMFFDNAYHTIGILAMLDPFLSLFTLLGVYLFVKYPYAELKHSLLRTTVFSLAGLVKYSGLFIVPAEFLEGLFLKGNKLFRIRNSFLALLRYYAVYPVLLILFSLPLIGYFGFEEWFKLSIINAFRWHLSTKTPPGAGPISSSPIDWLLGANSFTLWIDPITGQAVRCTGLPIVYLTGFILSLTATPWIIKLEKYRRLVLSFYSIWGMYMELYLLGNRSLYSFYIIHFTPILTVLTLTILVLLIIKIRVFITEKLCGCNTRVFD